MGDTLWELVVATAEAHPDRVVAVDDHGRSLTSARLRGDAEVAAAGLVALGIGAGSVVSWQLPTTLESVVMLVACARVGAVQNPIIPLLREREIEHITTQVGTDLFIAPSFWRGFDHAAMAAGLGLPFWTTDFDSSVDASTPMRLPAGDPTTLPPPPIDATECRWIYFSSGTTASPKGVKHTDRSVIASAGSLSERMGFGPEDVYPIAWPFTHIGGIAMLVTALRTGVRLVLIDVYDPMTSPERMATHSPTMLGSAQPFFRAFLDAQYRHGDEPLFPRVRGAAGGGAPIPGEINRELVEVFGIPGVLGAYGLTEFPNATSEWFDAPEVGHTVGPVGPGAEARVVGGELQLRGGQCCLGYVDTALDADLFTDDGWLRTGDLAEIDPDGRIRIVGRLKDVVIRNAENISSTEVEEAVLFHPAVADVAVIGLPDARTGERVCAAIVLEPDASVDVSGLAAHCIENGLAKYKCPEQVVVVASIPRNPMGKIQKDAVRAAVLEVLGD